jgi:hypothetical protein
LALSVSGNCESAVVHVEPLPRCSGGRMRGRGSRVKAHPTSSAIRHHVFGLTAHPAVRGCDPRWSSMTHRHEGLQRIDAGETAYYNARARVTVLTRYRTVQLQLYRSIGESS